MNCVVCGKQEHYAKGRCFTDYQFRRRNGRDRTWEQIARHNARVIDRALAALSQGRDTLHAI